MTYPLYDTLGLYLKNPAAAIRVQNDLRSQGLQSHGCKQWTPANKWLAVAVPCEVCVEHRILACPTKGFDCPMTRGIIAVFRSNTEFLTRRIL